MVKSRIFAVFGPRLPARVLCLHVRRAGAQYPRRRAGRSSQAVTGAGLSGVLLSAVLLLAGCTQVLAGKGAADSAALTSYLAEQSSSSSSSSAAASSKAAAVAAVCGVVGPVAAQLNDLWGQVSEALDRDYKNNQENKADLIHKMAVLLETAKAGQEALESASVDSSTDIGQTAAAFGSALAGYVTLWSSEGQVSGDDVRDIGGKVGSAASAVLGKCPSH